MKVIVAGSRSIGGNRKDTDVVEKAMFHDSPFEITELVHGGARGVDSIAANLFAMREESNENCTMFEPDYDEHSSKVAPIVRNAEMADYADALIAVWDGESNGTRDMIEKALDRGLDTYVSVVE